MNYIKQINSFWRLVSQFDKTEIRSSDIAVYFALLNYVNRFGWKEETNIDWILLAELSRLDIKTFRSSAERLNNVKLIVYTKGERNKAVPKVKIVKLYQENDDIDNQGFLKPILDSSTESTTDSNTESTTDSKPVSYIKPIKEGKEEKQSKQKPKKNEELVLLVVNHFEKQTGKKIRDGINNPNVKFIRQRLKDKIGVEELCSIIDLKFDEWRNDSTMKKFIRLQTLFNKEKCFNYLEELAEKKEAKAAVPAKENVTANVKFLNFKKFVVDRYGEKFYIAFNFNESNFEKLISGEWNNGIKRIYQFGGSYEVAVLPRIKRSVQAVFHEDKTQSNLFGALIRRIESQSLT